MWMSLHRLQQTLKLIVSNLPPVDRVISSLLQRALKLAQFIANRYRLAVEIDKRIAEIDFGSWEGRYWSEFRGLKLIAGLMISCMASRTVEREAHD